MCEEKHVMQTKVNHSQCSCGGPQVRKKKTFGVELEDCQRTQVNCCCTYINPRRKRNLVFAISENFVCFFLFFFTKKNKKKQTTHTCVYAFHIPDNSNLIISLGGRKKNKGLASKLLHMIVTWPYTFFSSPGSGESGGSFSSSKSNRKKEECFERLMLTTKSDYRFKQKQHKIISLST